MKMPWKGFEPLPFLKLMRCSSRAQGDTSKLNRPTVKDLLKALSYTSTRIIQTCYKSPFSLLTSLRPIPRRSSRGIQAGILMCTTVPHSTQISFKISPWLCFIGDIPWLSFFLWYTTIASLHRYSFFFFIFSKADIYFYEKLFFNFFFFLQKLHLALKSLLRLVKILKKNAE